MHDLAGSFEDVAAAYERGRPHYNSEVIAAIAAAAGGGPRLLDIGAGTGRLSGPLLRAGLDVVAVEPLAGMRAILTQTIGPARALAGRAEALPLDDASVDGAVCGDAWHWFDGPAAAAELRRVVRPHGGVVVSYLQPRDTGPRSDQVGAILEPLRQAAHHPNIARDRRPSDLETAGFAALERRDLPFVHATDREGMLAYYASISFVAALEPARRAEVLAALADVLARHEVHAIDVPYTAELWLTRRPPDPARPAGRPATAS